MLMRIECMGYKQEFVLRVDVFRPRAVEELQFSRFLSTDVSEDIARLFKPFLQLVVHYPMD